MQKKLFIATALLSFLVGCSNSPGTVEEYLAAAQKKYDNGDYFEARQLLAKALKLQPTDKEVMFQIGRNYAAEHMYDSSFASLSRADKLYPNDHATNELLYEVCVETERWSDAIQALLSMSKAGDPIEQHYLSLAECARKGGIGHVEEYYYGKLIELYPDSMSYYIYRAEGAYIMEKPDSSIEIMQSAVRMFGDKPELLKPLGKYYSLNGQLSEAEKVLRILVQKDSSVLNQLELATSLAFQDKRSKKEEAYVLFKKLRDRTPDRRQVDSLITILENELTAKNR